MSQDSKRQPQVLRSQEQTVLLLRRARAAHEIGNFDPAAQIGHFMC